MCSARELEIKYGECAFFRVSVGGEFRCQFLYLSGMFTGCNVVTVCLLLFRMAVDGSFPMQPRHLFGGLGGPRTDKPLSCHHISINSLKQ
jgi:hypothetical protein